MDVNSFIAGYRKGIVLGALVGAILGAVLTAFALDFCFQRGIHQIQQFEIRRQAV